MAARRRRLRLARQLNPRAHSQAIGLNCREDGAVSTKKELKKAVAAVWDEVKLLRTERRKLYAADEVAQSAAELSKRAERLQALSRDLSALSAMPPADAAAPKAKRVKPAKKAEEKTEE